MEPFVGVPVYNLKSWGSSTQPGGRQWGIKSSACPNEKEADYLLWEYVTACTTTTVFMW